MSLMAASIHGVYVEYWVRPFPKSLKMPPPFIPPTLWGRDMLCFHYVGGNKIHWGVTHLNQAEIDNGHDGTQTWSEAAFPIFFLTSLFISSSPLGQLAAGVVCICLNRFLVLPGMEEAVGFCREQLSQIHSATVQILKSSYLQRT